MDPLHHPRCVVLIKPTEDVALHALAALRAAGTAACLPGRLEAAAGLAGGEVDGRLHGAARLTHEDDLQHPVEAASD